MSSENFEINFFLETKGKPHFKYKTKSQEKAQENFIE